MKFFCLSVFLFFAHAAPAEAQVLPEWFRVQTFDDKSVVELNTDFVMFRTDRTGRVRFRWTYTEPQSLSRDSKVLYRSMLQEIAFDCPNKKYSIYETNWFDGDEKPVKTVKPKKDEEWLPVGGKTMSRLFPEACKLIDFRKREPAAEQ